MPITPIQIAGALAAAAPLAESAVSSVSTTFADLLAAVTPRDGRSAADAPGLGLEGLTGGLTTAAGEERLQSEMESLLGRFHQLLQGLLAGRDAELNGEVQLQSDATGVVQAVDETGNLPVIEELFGASPELRQLFDRIVSNAKLLRDSAGRADGSGRVRIVADERRAAIAG